MKNEKEIQEAEELEQEELDDEDLDLEEDFEFDDEGNIVIPDEDDGEEDEDDEDDEEDSPEGDGEEESLEDTPEENKPSEWEEKYRKLESQTKETLSKLNIKNDDVVAGLEQLAAETDNVPLEEYKQKKAEEARQQEAMKLLNQKEFEKLIANDLAAIQEAYPVAKKFNSVKDFPEFEKFGKFRDLGLSPAEAFAATHPSIIAEGVASSVKQQNLNNKNHLISTVPKGAKNNSISMSKKELAEWRDLFPGMSDKEILALYKDSLKK
ncbi:MAG: hypothetical protein J6A54_00825 [Clostridia bacterium]|nr:hypothetical protein [Clostridia bacterium]